MGLAGTGGCEKPQCQQHETHGVWVHLPTWEMCGLQVVLGVTERYEEELDVFLSPSLT